MAKDLPEVVSAVNVMSLEKENMLLSLRVGEKVIRSGGIFTGKNFFNMFSFPFLYGNPNHALNDKNAMVISEGLAINLFGTGENAIGKSIEWEIFGMKKQSQVSGVFNNLPANNSMHFDYALTQELLLTEIWTNGQKWWNEGPTTYIELKEGTNVSQFTTKIKDFIKKYQKENLFTLFLRPYSSAYLYGKYENGVQSGGRIEYVRLFSVIALFILLIACINFMNLSTAKATRRLKEVGIKKSVGASRGALAFQFLGESLFMSFLSLLLAIVLVIAFLPVFNALTGKQLSLQLSSNLITILLISTIVTGLVSGSYPAIYLSGFNPVAVLKGKIRNSYGEILARKGLVVFQFVISLVLIVSVMIINRQVNYVQSKNLGYNKENIIHFDKEGLVQQNTGNFLAELKKIPGVVNASAIQQSIVVEGGGSSTYGISWPGKVENTNIDFVVRTVDFNMLETFGMQMKEGRSFSEKYGDEKSKLIINETAAKIMGLKNPIGTPIRMWDQDMTIIGVVKDFHVSSLHAAIEPFVFRFNPEETMMIMARIEKGKEKETLILMENFYKKYNPGFVFDYKFLDQAVQAQYVSEKRVSILSRYFAGLAILISCLGLFGLATFNAEIRTKEIGIRKILGATAGNLVLLLSKDYLKLVMLAVVLAFPLSWWMMNKWLESFVYKIDIGSNVFLIAFATVIGLTFLTVSFQALKAALANPSNALRTE
jgi:putative ABC transport system permease protein